MKVSVIILTYNRAHMVTKAIDSVLKQTFEDFELIVVDNYSSDNTESVVKSYVDKRVRYFKNQNNGFIGVNRNYGIEKSRGEYIAFLDDDDLWMPEKLERQMLEFEKDNQIGLVCTNGINFDSRGERGERLKAKLKDSDFTFKSLMWNNAIICSSVLVKRQAIEDVGMVDESPEIFTAEDYELWLRVAKRYRVKYIDLPLVKYRIHAGAHGSKGRIEAIELTNAVYRKLLDKGIIDSNLYQKRISSSNRQILVLKLPGYKWVIKYASFLMRVFRPIANGVRKMLGTDRS